MKNKGLLYAIATLLLIIAVGEFFLRWVWTERWPEIERIVRWTMLGIGILWIAAWIRSLRLSRSYRLADVSHTTTKRALNNAGTVSHTSTPALSHHNTRRSPMRTTNANEPLATSSLPSTMPAVYSPSIIPGYAQHIGARKEQQDAFGFSPFDDPHAIQRHGVLAVLADGIGGLAMGREAGQLAVETMRLIYEAKMPEDDVMPALIVGIQQANLEVYQLAKQHDLQGSVGTTLAAAVIQDHQLYWVSAGDSRIYLYRHHVLTQLTTDHVYATQLNQWVTSGHITEEQAVSHPDRHRLTSYLGLPEVVDIDFNYTPLPIQQGDLVLLCSDGFYQGLTENMLRAAPSLAPQCIAEWLIEQILAEAKPHQDNATVAILACP
ncbi:hypothetical protein BVG16_09960 [Paenibacillus selenitireducens]|uniref:PPM-type phosphatase domain-containing protein n=2 Tax=Paenibacillus selenitireducens TaxID=1324314 RepID=A0A1T2XHV8_9BACL|nr:protein phosphatase 2C domain-containing protein [Paenibacillus selenitireducens]OPA79395.1 hypothetical protein BVG16_09960 [Paenibacillus selenitireducens]